MLTHAVHTDTGVVRSVNQDDYAVNKLERLYVVCDGMGGHKGGETAAHLACEAMDRFITETRSGAISELPFDYDGDLSREANRLVMAVRWANRRVWEVQASNPVVQGMGTTVAAALIDDSSVHIAHVGDSRVYRYREGHLELLTRDHSYVNELVDAGDISAEDAHGHPERNAIARAVGGEKSVEVECRTEKWEDEDILLLCTDGLWDHVSDRKMADVFQEAPDPERGTFRLDWAAKELVRLANRAGGDDNITVLLVHDES